jgi:hypothetical protein
LNEGGVYFEKEVGNLKLEIGYWELPSAIIST